MKKDFLTFLSLIVLSIGSSITFYQCKKTSTGTSTGTSHYKGQEANEIWIQNMAFNPGSITVAVNTTVKWINKDTSAHRVTSAVGLFDSGYMNESKTFSHQFSAVGTYPYKCSLHSGMTGTVIVQ